jgi:hypothetical protein
MIMIIIIIIIINGGDEEQIIHVTRTRLNTAFGSAV